MTVANFARTKNFSTTWVYALAKRGKLLIKEIDGIKFVIVK